MLAVALLAQAAPAKADFAAGVAAYKQGRYTEALARFEPLATGGDARAQFALGLLYDNGEGVARDDDAAFTWYRRAAEQGYAKAEYNLALMLERGRASAATTGADAREWYLRAARRGNTDAVTRVHDYASTGDVTAQRQLGRMYALGEGVAKSPRDAFGWFSKAAAAGDAEAAFALGVQYERGEGTPRSDEQAARWYAAAAAADHAAARYNLARLQRLGRGVARDLEAARAGYEAAAEAGLVRAQLTLAMLFEAGQGWPHDLDRALVWYIRAAKNGSAEAQVNLAYLHADGIGTAPDRIEACALLELARDARPALAADNHRLLCEGLDATAQSAVAARVAAWRAPATDAARLSAR